MSEKVLTVAVPSYNAADYLLDTIPTMANIPNAKLLEVIIVNDGSKDNTLEIAKQLENQYPNVIRIIDKENGGHGSTINAAIQEAKGRYFKVIDADDWVLTENFNLLVEYLQKCDDDEVISPYHRVYVDKNKQELVEFKVSESLKTYDYDSLLGELDEIPEMHSKTTKTSILKENQIMLDENCFYVDMEYITFPMPFIQSISYFPMPIYQYRLGTEVQSVNIKNFIKNEKMHEKVLFQVINFYKTYENTLSKLQSDLVLKLISRMISTHYNIFFAKDISKKTKNQLLKFEELLSTKDSKFVTTDYGRKVSLIRKTNYLGYWPIAIVDHLKYKLK